MVRAIKERVDNNNKQKLNMIGKKFSEGVKNKNLIGAEGKLTYAECVAKGAVYKKLMT